LLTSALTLVLIGVLVAALVTDLDAHARTRQERRTLALTRQKLATARFNVAATRYAAGLARGHLLGLQHAVTAALAQLATTDQTLAATNKSAYIQGVDIGTLHTCLGGVQAALQQIRGHDNAAATGDISAVSSACLTLEGGQNGGPAYPFDFPDPFVLRVGATYFAYATNSAEGNIQIIASTDLSQWSAVGNALPKLPGWAAPNATWAPSVRQIGGTFVLYYSAVVAGAGGGEQCISAATSSRPQGPFVDSSTAPLVCQASLGGSIDPSPFADANGTPYLVWKSNGGAGQPALIWSEQLNPAGTGFAAAAPTELLAPDQSWQGGVIEAPDLVLQGGHYLLFYSGNNWNSANYAVGVATCLGPIGPCTEPLTQPILASGPTMAGPGGATVFTDAAGTWWMAFDAWLPGQVGYPHSRALYLRRLTLSGGAPVVDPPG
jgi:hypothetical protein